MLTHPFLNANEDFGSPARFYIFLPRIFIFLVFFLVLGLVLAVEACFCFFSLMIGDGSGVLPNP